MSVQQGYFNMPFKVVIFAASPMAMPTIEMLLQQQRLAGVVLPEMLDAFSDQLEQWLGQIQCPYVRADSQKANLVADSLRRWETDLAITFAYNEPLGKSCHINTSFGIFHFHPTPISQYQGPAALYWLLRDGAPATQLTLQKAGVAAGKADIALAVEFPIDAVDTLQCVENNIAQAAPELVFNLIEQIQQRRGMVELHAVQHNAQSVDTPMLQQQHLYVNWQGMGSLQIVDAARAGNSQLGGCVVVLGDRALNLLEATAVTHPTYGVPPGTICHIGEPEGVIVATVDGAVRLDVMSNSDGIYSGVKFFQRFGINAGMEFVSAPVTA